ncbi:tetratricopeptide repeat protein, partial [candidate division KSB1 bacterium]|nr:tetratricopeptide repeat protein [candidate division KSB1 bacterium]
MRIIFKIFVVFTLTFIAGCAYYNTFFNAKKFYKEAEKGRLKDLDKENEITTSTKQKYQQAIEKASRLLEYYPKSRYVDDALFLLGKSFFYREEYQNAKRKFEEIIENFPASEFIPEARLWLGKTNSALQYYDIAEKNFQDITIFKARQEIIDEAQYLLGGLHFDKADYISALNEYKLTAQNARDKALRSQAYYQMGECYLKLQDFSAAASSFEKAKKYSADPVSEFKAQFKAGLARKDLKQYDEAIAIFLDLLGNIANEDSWPKCKLEVASCLYLKGEISNAIFWYETITEEHKRTEQAANAYFNLGLIYQRDKIDY